MTDVFAPRHPCPACQSVRAKTFYVIRGVPVHSVLLIDSREEAVAYSSGDIELTVCLDCGFIFNRAFRPEVHDYSERYDPTQGYSPTFNAFHKQLALDLIERYDLHQRKIIEIGCGQGEFLTLLCELGDNHGVGFDPAYLPVREESRSPGRTHFIPDYYSVKYAGYQADFVCCKMTLEHIPDVMRFMKTVHNAIAARTDTVVFFQLPDTSRILRDVAFWDIYYEHCSYFTLGSLARLFRRAGFTILDLWRAYDDQYLMLVARPNAAPIKQSTHTEEENVGQLTEWVEQFETQSASALARWRQVIEQFHKNEERVVLWGGGSKAVAFLTTLGVNAQVSYVVDINPRKHGTFIAGSGQEIVSPTFLCEYRPDVVIIMNAIYREEISNQLSEMGLHPTLITVEGS